MKRFLTIAILFICQSANAAYLKECGPGNMIAGDFAGGSIAITLNIASSTSGASTTQLSTPELCGWGLWSAAKYIDTNLPMIEQDTAMGGGEHMVAMLDILECDISVRPNIINEVRQGYANHVNVGQYESLSHKEKVINYFNVVQATTSNYSKNCAAI